MRALPGLPRHDPRALPRARADGVSEDAAITWVVDDFEGRMPRKTLGFDVCIRCGETTILLGRVCQRCFEREVFGRELVAGVDFEVYVGGEVEHQVEGAPFSPALLEAPPRFTIPVHCACGALVEEYEPDDFDRFSPVGVCRRCLHPQKR